jgi:hypothetical protein
MNLDKIHIYNFLSVYVFFNAEFGLNQVSCVVEEININKSTFFWTGHFKTLKFIDFLSQPILELVMAIRGREINVAM